MFSGKNNKISLKKERETYTQRHTPLETLLAVCRVKHRKAPEI
jgi:hypothetical protein